MKYTAFALLGATSVKAKCITSKSGMNTPFIFNAQEELTGCTCDSSCDKCSGFINTKAKRTKCIIGSCNEGYTENTQQYSDVSCNLTIGAPCTAATTAAKTPCVAPFIETDKVDFFTEKYSGVNGQGYRGRQNKTLTGLECQKWADQTPISHDRTTAQFPDAGLESNFCRNPNNNPFGIWCYLAGGTNQGAVDNALNMAVCAPLVKPECKSMSDCYEDGFKGGACGQYTVKADYKKTEDTENFGSAVVLWDGKEPKAGISASMCLTKKMVDQWAGALNTDTTVDSTAHEVLTNLITADGGLNGVEYGDTNTLYSAAKTDKETMKAITLDLIFLDPVAKKAKEEAAKKEAAEKEAAKSDDSAMKVAVPATVALIAASLF